MGLLGTIAGGVFGNAWQENIKNNKGYQPDFAGAPQIPDYVSVDPSKATIGDLGVKRIGLDTSGMDKFRAEAFRDPGTESKFAQMAKGREMTQLGLDQDQALRLTGGNTATAFSKLGGAGVTQGAAERVAKAGNRDAMEAIQKLGAGAGQRITDIGIADERNRIEQLGRVPGLDLQTQGQLQGQELNLGQLELGRQQFNANQQQELANGQNEYNMTKYDIQAPIWAGLQQAQMIQNPKKGFLGNMPILGDLFG